MIKRNKRGVEAIVGTILVLLIAIAVAGILWQVVVPMTKKGSTQAQLTSTCLAADVKIVSRDSYFISDATENENNTVIVVSRGAGELDLKDVQVILYDSAGNSEPILLKSKYNYDVPAENAQRVYNINATTLTPSKAAVAIQLKIGEETKFCNPSEKIDLESITSEA